MCERFNFQVFLKFFLVDRGFFHGQPNFFLKYEFFQQDASMHRRHFLSALLGAAWAGTAAAQTQRKKRARKQKTSSTLHNPANTVATPEKSIIDQPVQGGVTDNLPPLKAPGEPEKWRNFEVIYRFALPENEESEDIFAPLTCDFLPLYQRQKRLRWQGQVACELLKLPQNRADILKINTPAQEFFLRTARGNVEIKMEIALAARRFDIGRRSMPPENEDILRENLNATPFIPNRGNARNLALQIIGRIQDPLAQARALYDWVIEKSTFAPQKILDAGNAKLQILSKTYGGNSSDIGCLFVALCRAIGIPARNVYGVQLTDSQIATNLTAQPRWQDNAHTRSEFYIPGYGWIGVDLGAVLKSATRIPATKESLQKRYFGFWEPNWLALHWGTLENILPQLPVLIAPLAAPAKENKTSSNNKGKKYAPFAPKVFLRELP